MIFKNTLLILFYVLFSTTGFTQTANDTLIGLVDNKLIKINRNTGASVFETDITNLGPVSDLIRITWSPLDNCFYTIAVSSGNYILGKISINGVFTSLGAVTLPNQTVFLMEGIAFNKFDNQLYVSASLDGGVNSSPPDYWSETLLTVNTTTLAATVIGTFSHPSGQQSEADVINFDALGNLIYNDGVPGSSSIFYEQPSNMSLAPSPIYSTSYHPTSDLTVKNNVLYYSYSRTLRQIDLATNAQATVGAMFTATDYNGALLRGISHGCETSIFDFSDTVLCANQGIVLDATRPNSTYLWSNNSTTPSVTISNAGTYWVEVNTGDCVIYDTVVVLGQLNTISLGNDTTICSGESITLQAPNNAQNSILWSDNSTGTSITADQTGYYWVEITSALCNLTVRDSLFLTVNPVPSVNLGNDTIICEGETLLLDAFSNNATYLWQDNSTNSNYFVNQSGTYSVTNELNGCSDTDTIIVSILASPLANLGANTQFCQGSSVILDATFPNATYLWQDNSTMSSFEVTSPGSYHVTVNSDDCVASDTISFTYFPNTNLAFVIPDSICSGENATFSLSNQGAQIQTIKWNFGDNNFTYGLAPTHIYEQGGNYTVTVEIETEYNCIEFYSFNLFIIQSPIANFTFTPNQPVKDEIINFEDASNSANTWSWTFGDGANSIVQNPSHAYHSKGTYTTTLTVTNDLCKATVSKTIVIKEPMVFYIPNAFTPNGNGPNNVFKPIFSGAFDAYSYQLTIFNRWGEVVFLSENQEAGWDGYYNGKLAQDGTYVWKVDYSDLITDENKTETGFVTLLR